MLYREKAKIMRTQVGIVGAGPAGLLLAHMLHLQGISSVIIEQASQAHVQGRIRAGVMEHDAAALLRDIGMGARMDRQGLLHHGITLRFGGASHRIDLTALTGKSIMVYGQHEVVTDLIAARQAAGLGLLFDVRDTQLHDIDTGHPSISFQHDGQDQVLECDFIAGCDGFHGISRPALASFGMTGFDRQYPCQPR